MPELDLGNDKPEVGTPELDIEVGTPHVRSSMKSPHMKISTKSLLVNLSMKSSWAVKLENRGYYGCLGTGQKYVK